MYVIAAQPIGVVTECCGSSPMETPWRAVAETDDSEQHELSPVQMPRVVTQHSSAG